MFFLWSPAEEPLQLFPPAERPSGGLIGRQGGDDDFISRALNANGVNDDDDDDILPHRTSKNQEHQLLRQGVRKPANHHHQYHQPCHHAFHHLAITFFITIVIAIILLSITPSAGQTGQGSAQPVKVRTPKREFAAGTTRQSVCKAPDHLVMKTFAIVAFW